MLDIYDGDTALFLTLDGGNISYSNGQPQMDAGGLETAVNISLFTNEGWVGNALDDGQPDRQIGSRFEQTLSPHAITAQVLRDINQAGEDALQWMINVGVAETVTVNATSPELNIVNVEIDINRGDGTTTNIFYELNWIAGVMRPVTAKVR